MVNPVPVQSNALTGNSGTPTEDMYRWMQSVRSSNVAANATLATKAAKAQTWQLPIFIEYPENKDYRVIVNSQYVLTVTNVVTVCKTGTATVTGKVNTTALGGSTNSASSTEQNRAHTSSNVAQIGDDFVVTVSSASSIEDLTILVYGTYSLA